MTLSYHHTGRDDNVIPPNDWSSLASSSPIPILIYSIVWNNKHVESWAECWESTNMGYLIDMSGDSSIGRSCKKSSFSLCHMYCAAVHGSHLWCIRHASWGWWLKYERGTTYNPYVKNYTNNRSSFQMEFEWSLSVEIRGFLFLLWHNSANL